MKTLIKIAAVAFFFLTACTSANQLSSTYDDDGVYTSKKAKAVVQNQAAEVKQNTANQTTTNYTETTPKSYNATEATSDKSKQSYEKYKQTQAENANQISYDTNAPQPLQEIVAVQDNNQNYSNYDADDYYDYGYSSRLRRFHNPCHSFGYYDDYYTNMYWYNHDPFYYGTSIYMGYNWWGPSYSFYSPYYWNNWGWNIGFGFGWGIGMVYSDWYSPYWGGYYGYGGYGGYGYGHGYNDGYWASNHNNSSSHFYGPRNFIGSSNGSIHRATSTGTNVGGKKEPEIRTVSAPFNASRGVNSDNPSNTGVSDRKDPVKSSESKLTEPANPNSRTTDSKAITPNQDKPAATVSNTDSKRTEPNTAARVETPNSNTRNYSTPATRINNYQRYSRSNQEQKAVNPANTNTSPNTYNYRDPKSYNSPNYTQPRSSQEFEAPKYKSERNYNNRAAQTQTQPANTQETPRQNNNYNNRSYTTPANNENRNTTPPVNTERKNYSTPSTNYSTPAPSRSTYSAPPSNSGGNSGGSRSGGNSGGTESQRRR